MHFEFLHEVFPRLLEQLDQLQLPPVSCQREVVKTLATLANKAKWWTRLRKDLQLKVSRWDLDLT